MNIKCFDSYIFHSNTYIAYDAGEAAIIDCGAPCGEISKYVREHALTVKFIILTHGHCDHVDFIDEYVKEFPEADIICHEDEVKVLTDIQANVSWLFGRTRVYDYPYKTVKEGDSIKIGAVTFSVMHTPGHTPGGICLHSESERIVFTGDVLFFDGCGRTDFTYGSPSDMWLSLQRLLRLDEETIVYPGHDRATKIGIERANY